MSYRSASRPRRGEEAPKKPRLVVSTPSQTVYGIGPPDLWGSLEDFYTANRRAIEEAERMDVIKTQQPGSKKSQWFETAANTFVQHAGTIVQGVEVIGELHPAAKVAVVAFTAVIRIELARRDNDLKATSVKIQLLNLMCALFQIRYLREKIHLLDAHFEDWMHQLGKEVKECGSDLSCYHSKTLISRLIHIKHFEARFAEHISTFALRRSELQMFIANYTADAVQDIAQEVRKVTITLARVDGEVVQKLEDILQRLESPRERDAKRFVEDKGGMEKCIGDKTLLETLVEKTGDSEILGTTNPTEKLTDEGYSARKIESLMKRLQGELKEDIKDTLQKHLSKFEAEIRVQNKNLENRLIFQSSQLMNIHNELAMIQPGLRAHILISDEVNSLFQIPFLPAIIKANQRQVMQEVWRMMGLKRSVKAKKFVLTFKDYHARQYPKPSVLLTSPAKPRFLTLKPSTDLEDESAPAIDSATISVGPEETRGQGDEDDWALTYIDVVHLDPIVEAIDDDFSGFISIHEANRFALSRPDGWSLLRWFAYWAAGWAISLNRYKGKISDLIQEMYNARQHVLPCNAAYVDADYFDSHAYAYLDAVLRSTRPPDSEYHDTKLTALVRDFEQIQEDRIQFNLKELEYTLSSVEKVSLVTGHGRIERSAFPVIYLLLQRHLRLIKLAAHYPLPPFEMSTASDSLFNVIRSLVTRAKKLEVIFRQKSRAVQDQLKSFSFGMLELFAIESTSYQPVDSKLLDWNRCDNSSTRNSDELRKLRGPGSVADGDQKIASWAQESDPLGPDNLGEHVHTIDLSQPPPLDTLLPNADIFSGSWCGRMYEQEGASTSSALYSFVIRFDRTSPGSEVAGVLETDYGSLTLFGTLRYDGSGRTSSHNDAELGEGGQIDERDTEAVTAGGEGAAHSRLDGLKAVILDFETCPIPGYSSRFHFWLRPADGEDARHWKGQWCHQDPDWMGMKRSCELFRKPCEALRYLHIIEEPSVQVVEARYSRKARALWGYAIAIILLQVRQRRHAPSHYREMAKERKRFIHLQTRYIEDSLVQSERNELFRMTVELNPSVTSVWGRTAKFYSERKVGSNPSSSTVCDYCGKDTLFVRHFCLTCMLDTMGNQVDICDRCIGTNDSKPVTTSNFSHEPSHTLFKTRRRLLKMERARHIEEARTRSQRVKTTFSRNSDKGCDASETVKNKTISQQKPTTHTDAPRCFHCSKEIRLPCWVCNVCPQDTLICMRCEAKGEHKESHTLLRIVDNVFEALSPKKADLKADYVQSIRTMVEGGMESLEGRVTGALESKMEALGQEAKKTMENVSESLDSKMAALEAKLDHRMNDLGEKVEKIERRVSSYHSVPPTPSSAVTIVASPSPGEYFKHKHIPQHSEEYPDTLADRMDALEGKVDSRLKTLEDLLGRVLDAIQAT